MEKTKQAPRVLPADVYDTLEFSALVYGGIGAGRGHDYSQNSSQPFCLFGHAEHAGVNFVALDAANISPCYSEGEDGVANDPAVRAINKRRRNPDLNARVPFAALVKEMNVTRGT